MTDRSEMIVTHRQRTTPRWPVVFLDRDGVINRTRPDYVKHWDEFELLPGAVEAVTRICATGRDVIVLTNQSAIGRGLMTAATVQEIHGRLSLVVEAAGGHIRAFLVCPHAPADRCLCRKPAPGLFFRARDELGLALPDAIMVGDQPADVKAAWAAGCSAILVAREPAAPRPAAIANCPVASDLDAAVDMIVNG